MKTKIKQGHLNEVFCLKHGNDMNDFSLKHDQEPITRSVQLP